MDLEEAFDVPRLPAGVRRVAEAAAAADAPEFVRRRVVRRPGDADDGCGVGLEPAA